MNNFLPIVQRVLEVAPIRGKGRLAELLLKGERKDVACHPLPGVTIHLNPQQRIERLMWAGAYEPGLVRILKSLLKPGMIFLDLGANVGYFAAIAAGLVGNQGRVLAFEPAPNCFTRLQRNLSGFPQAFVYNYAAIGVGKIVLSSFKGKRLGIAVWRSGREGAHRGKYDPSG